MKANDYINEQHFIPTKLSLTVNLQSSVLVMDSVRYTCILMRLPIQKRDNFEEG